MVDFLPMSSIASAARPAKPALSQKRILFLWLPLAASWLLMALEMPYISAALARLSEAERMIAAFGLAASLSMTIESPVVSLLSTSTALARSRQNYLLLRGFTIHLMIGTTIVQFLLGWTPLYDLVVKQILGVPASLHAPVQLGLQLMLPWSAAIAWRRFRQGILIRYGQSGQVGRGTILRLLGSAGSATILALLGASGIVVGTLALSVGVMVEAIYTQWASAPLVRERFGEGIKSSQADLGYMELVNFHWPLAASNLLYLFTQPMIAAALARGLQADLDLAAWPVVSGLLFISRAPEMALPEVTIAVSEEEGSQAQIRRFSLAVGLIFTVFLLLLSVTPLSEVYFGTLIGLSGRLGEIAQHGTQYAILTPLALAFVSVSRGLLTSQRHTQPQAWAMVLELVTLALVLLVGTVLHLPGVAVASFGMSAALIIEAFYLWFVLRPRRTQKG